MTMRNPIDYDNLTWEEWEDYMSQKRTEDAYSLAGEHPADRVLRAVKNSNLGHMGLEPSVVQVAAVLHALADQTHNFHMLGSSVAGLADDSDGLAAQAIGLGRYFHGLGDYLDGGSNR